MTDPTTPAARRVLHPMPQSDGRLSYRHNLTRTECTDLVVLCVSMVNVLPIIFVPGVMGSNLRALDEKKTKVWNLDSNAALFLDKRKQNAGERQNLLHPDRTVVDNRGAVPTKPVGSITASDAKALKALYQRRGWGEVGVGSYQDFLMVLEETLNGHRSLRHESTDVAAKVSELMKLRAKDPADQPWRPQKGEAHSEPADIENLRKWLFPVYACGYNWLDDNAKSANRLRQCIQQRIAENNSTYSRCEQVIVVTHSMGGLVARACQQLEGMEARIAGIVHGVMPVDGAPIAYRRCKVGVADENSGLGMSDEIMGGLAAKVLGNTGQEVTAIFAQAPGPLELLPTQRYKKEWLEIRDAEGKVVQKKLPADDPYEEIYRRRDRWWALIKEKWLSPEDGVPIRWRDYLRFLDKAEKFHKQVTPDSYHPHTYAFYGASSKGKTRSYESVVWRMKRSRTLLPDGPTPDEVYGMTPRQVEMDGTNPERVTVKRSLQKGRSGELPVDVPQWELQADLAGGTGDGTVPALSGRSPAACPKVREVFRLSGLEHEPAFRDESPVARQVTLYAISKIAREARLPLGAAFKAKG